MAENGVETNAHNACGGTASGAVHRHINNDLLGFGFSAVVAIAELEGFQAVFTAIKLCT